MIEREDHPAFGMIGAYRTSISPPGSSLFDSDVRHQHTVVVKLSHAARSRDLHRDWIHGREEIVEIEMSEAQWASFVSSINTSGVPCTLRRLQGEQIEQLPFAPRLEASMRETREAAHRAFDAIVEALDAYEATLKGPAQPRRDALGTLRAKIKNAMPNVDFAGKSLAEHAENVVQKARADVEAMIAAHAAQLGIEAPEASHLAIDSGKEEA